ncbi:amino acid adenylation domain-containing protein [Archangium gephyra]|uniref:Amino acid adenylation domain-containing protein n=2 Tax=Archangium gephyra TaxID=48 RepID=A0AAC8TDY0_9BACT|nr:Malonyl CoA-acyl carrier protein transacylase [Archangium gephyra]REG28631.1 amino acid adenylation domain-containing protein [Archangium gephyra]
MERHNPFHNQLAAVELHGALDDVALEQALRALVREHEILRTRFTAVGGQPYQFAELDMPVPLARVDLRALTPAERAEKQAQWMRDEARFAFDLEQGPLLRATLLRLGEQEHVLLLALHQMICDPDTVPMLVDGLVARYEAGGRELTAPVPQYAAFAERQEQWLRSSEAREQVEAWRRRLAGAPQVVTLPTDHLRPGVQTYSGATLHAQLPGEFVQELSALARDEGTRLFDVLLAALQVVLHRYADQAEPCIGTPSSLRDAHSDGALGSFGNLIVLRGDLRADPTFRALLTQAHQRRLEALQGAQLPFEHLVEALQVERSLVYTPCFQVTFALQEAPARTWELPGLRLRLRPLDPDFARYDLSLVASATEHGLDLAFTYNTDLFEAATLRRLQGHYVNVLRQAVEAPRRRVSELSLMSEPERTQVLREWNATAADYPREHCIHELIAEHARLRPEAVALTHGQERLTYGELERRANQVAHELARLGVGPERLVGLCMERSPESIVGLLGILKAGGVYLPLDPAYPRERLRYMLRDSGATVLLTQERLLERMPSMSLSVLVLDRDREALEAHSPLPPAPPLTSANAAYVIYTSGSTGKPKGVLLSHRGLVNHATSLRHTYRLTPADRVLQCASISFDVSLEEIFPTLVSGAALVQLPFERLPSVSEFLRMVEQEALTVLNVPTAYWHEWVAEATFTRTLPPPGVRLVIVGGERASPEQLSAWRALTGERGGWINAYGPTEATITSTLFALAPDSPEMDAHVGIPIGRPIANTRVYVLDRHGRPVPPGVPGELYLGGEGLARGYLGRPELTAERFVPDHLSGELGARLYRTGDLASYLPDGALRFWGRVDHQVKVRGFRIELGEIEAHLEEHPAVREAVAVVREDVAGQPRIVAYVVPESAGEAWGASVDTQALNAEQVSQWQVLYDDAYNRAADEEDAEFNTASWNSSYTGEPISDEEMKEYVDHTLARLRELEPRRALEIGCGTGLLLVRLAPHCELFTGADFAQGALRGLQRYVDRQGKNLGQIQLLHRAADDFTGIAPGSHDTVIINSVLQHFPTVDYLVKVLEGSVATVGPSGRIFVGDVRSLPLLESFALSVELFRAQDSMTVEQLLQGVQRRVAQDNELVVDPGFFLALQTHLPQIRRVDIHLKRGLLSNELSRFRYDVVLHVGEAAEPQELPTGLDWKLGGLTVEKLRQLLKEERPERLRVTRIPNTRMRDILAVREVLERDEAPATVGELRARLQQQPALPAVHPEELWALGEEFPYSVNLCWSGGEVDGAFELRLVRHGAAPASASAAQELVDPKPWRAYTNQPLLAALSRQLAPLLREYLAQSLPEYMVPAAILNLEALPRTPNGKVDRKALPAPLQSGLPRTGAVEAPRNPIEEMVAGIWAEVLGGGPFGLHDSFFELGGHSLLATQVISRVSRHFGVELPLHALFDKPTISGLAELITASLRAARGVQPTPLQAAPRGQPLPASFAQQRLWFLQQLAPGSVSYTMPFALELKGKLEVPALEQALRHLVHRHESLRTTFTVKGDELFQVVGEAPSSLPLPLVDLAALAEPERQARLREQTEAQVRTPFELERGPLLRQCLVKLDEQEHVLLLTMHHIISDGWSMGVLVRELRQLYEALSAQREPGLGELPLQYADYALWQRQWLRGEVLERQISYWKQQLADVPTLELPTDRPRSATSARGATIERSVLPAALVEQIHALCRREGVTLFMSLLAGFQVLLSRYSGQRDFAIGTPIANRNRSELEGLVGFFVNTLALRTQLSGRSTSRELLQQVRAMSLEAYAHQDIPFEQVVEAVRPERQLERHPLFQVMFAVQNAPLELHAMGGVELKFHELGTGAAKFDLIFTAEQLEQGLTLSMEYATGLFDAATIQRMLGHFQVLMEGLVSNPETPLASLPLLTPEERQRLLVEWNSTSTSYPADSSIHSLFSLQASLHPDSLALEFDSERLTYAQLEARSNQLAHHLRSLGVGPDCLVALFLERSASLFVSMLAALKAGGAYLPLDTSYPKERLALMLRDARPRLLLTSEALAASLPPSDVPTVLLDSVSLSSLPSSPPPSSTLPLHLAYVIYTSGSTGQPKGISIPHRAVVRLVRNTAYHSFASDERIAQLSNASFDAATFEVWGALLNGGTLVGLPRDVILSPDAFAEQLASKHITSLFITSALFNQVAQLAPTAFTHLRSVLAGGDRVDPSSARKVLQHGPPQRLLNGYGPTENTTFSTWHHIQDVPESAANIPIGIPLSNSTAYVLDASLQPVPVGVPGELYVGGDGLARGYLAQPALTAERFVPHPFSASPGERLYRTGDIVRQLPSGAIEFLGRADTQVKIRGFRIEPSEVEAVLLRHSSVRECVVLAREDSPGDRRLVAYAVPHAGLTLEASALRAHLQQTLPEYMVPSAFVLLEALPITPNGKVDRKALPVPDASQFTSEDYVAPRDHIEALLASLFAQVLGLPRVGIHDHFFALGGHSLLATRVTSRIREALHVEVPLRALFSSPTVAGLAEHVRQAKSASLPPLLPAPRNAALPLSFSQQRLWLVDQMQPGSPAYNIPFALHLSGALQPEVLHQSLEALTQRHESLRTSFPTVNGQPVQHVAPQLELPLPLVDLSELPEPSRSQRLQELLTAEARKPFDLRRAPLLRCTLLRLSASEHVLLLTMHHIVTDGWSLDVLFRELGALYAAFSSQQSSPLPALPLQYADFSLWQRQWLQGDSLERQLSFWKQQLADLPHLELPTDRPRPALRSHRGATSSFLLPPSLSSSLHALCQREGVTPFMALLATFQVLLSRYSGQRDFAVGSPIAGRTRTELEGLVGFFVNTLVHRAHLQPGASFRQHLASVQRSTLNAYEHQDIPFEKLVEVLQPQRDSSRSPLFQVMFALQNLPAAELHLSGLTVRSLEIHDGTTRFDLELVLEERAEGLHGSFIYSTELFDEATVARMAGQFQVLLEGIVSNPDAPLSALPLLTAQERQRLLVEWNDTSTAYPADTTLHALFEQQVAQRPEATAVLFGEQKLTYAQLDARANQLAWRLRHMGVGPDALVALCLERSLELIISLLAILKAGGAYVPLDTSYPAQRLSFMLEDSRPRLLLTTRAQLAQLPAQTIPSLLLDETDTSQEPSTPPPSGATSRNLAYVDFTSGSTGRPKGVAIEHRSVARLVRSVRYAEFSAEHTFLLIAPISFDASTLEVWGPLLNGATLAVFPPQSPGDVALLAQVLAQHRVSTLHLTAGLLTHMVDSQLEAMRGLKQLLTGGDVVSPPHVRRVLEELRIPVTACYGPTESTTFTSCWRMSEPSQVGTAVPIGTPISNTQVYLLDAAFQPVPVGVPGQLYIGGDGLARGYLSQPELTAERFLPNPFSSSPGERLYHTGDLARWRADGVLEFLGRADTQVKIRGFRIEPSEVEAALLRHPSVRECIVLAHEFSAGDKRLVAYAVPHAGLTLEASALRTHLQQTLPEYMVPSAFVVLEALPLTPNGKVDRKALPAPHTGQQEEESAQEAPRNPVEELVAVLMAEVLSVPRVGLHENFFSLGGHSLLATKLVSQLRATFQVTIPLRAVFKAPTAAGLTELLLKPPADPEQLLRMAQQALAGRNAPLTAPK